MATAKDVWIPKKPTNDEVGVGIFRFLDDFSVFDYGKMPGGIPGKGNSLWTTSTYNFEMASNAGFKTHYIGKLTPNLMAFRAANICAEHRECDNTSFGWEYQNVARFLNQVIPLEIIYRNELGSESSIMKMAKAGKIHPADIGLKEFPEDGKLPHPIITYTTKFEPTDMFLKRQEAYILSGLQPKEFDWMEQMALNLNHLLNTHTNKVGKKYKINLTHPDGKCEMVFVETDDVYPKNIMVGDVFGTLDEDRFEILLDDGTKMKLSKQILRNWYKKTDWYPEFEKWKEEHHLDEKPKPPQAPKELVDYVSNAYLTFARMWTLEAKKSEFNSLESQFRDLVETGVI